MTYVTEQQPADIVADLSLPPLLAQPIEVGEGAMMDEQGALSDIRAKRVFDVVGSLLLLVLFLPLWLIVVVAVKVSSSGPVLFRQQRVGAGGELFSILKFRSMHRDAEGALRAHPELHARYLANDHKLPLKEDPRITPVGRVIRQLSLDELPQLWNVARGDMALVGPRPIVPTEIPIYGGRLDAYVLTRPGVTGAWQVAGRSSLAYADRVQLDVDYFEQWSLARDLAILAKTPLAVASCRGSL